MQFSATAPAFILCWFRIYVCMDHCYPRKRNFQCRWWRGWLAVNIPPKGSVFMGTEDGPMQNEIEWRSWIPLINKNNNPDKARSKFEGPELSGKSIFMYHIDKMHAKAPTFRVMLDGMQGPRQLWTSDLTQALWEVTEKRNVQRDEKSQIAGPQCNHIYELFLSVRFWEEFSGFRI